MFLSKAKKKTENPQISYRILTKTSLTKQIYRINCVIKGHVSVKNQIKELKFYYKQISGELF
jgi:hypothetical protein